MARPNRHVWRWIVVGAFVFVLGIGIAGGILGLRVRHTVLAADSEATVAKQYLLAGAQILKGAGTGLTTAQSAQAQTDFQAAETHFAAARTLLAQSRLIGALRAAPWAGTQINAAVDLSDAGIHISRSGFLLAGALGQVLGEEATGTQRAKVSPGVKVLDTLDALDPKLSQLSDELDLVSTDRSKIPGHGLVPPLQSAVAQFDQKLDLQTLRAGLDTLRKNEPAIREVLGANGSRTYLVLQQDPAELRATGGFIGSVAFLGFDHGKLAPFAPSDVYRIDNNLLGQSVLGPPGTRTHVDAPFPLQHVFHLTSWELRDSNWSPDFPTSARQAEDFLKRETGRTVDGVIAIDPYFIQRLLTLTGPISVPQTGDVITDKNFFATTLARVEVSRAASNKSFLSQAANAIFARLLAIPPSKWPALLQVVTAGCNTRSLQAYFHASTVASLVDDANCGGAVRPLAADGLLVIDSNVGGNKDDYWLQRQFSVQIAMKMDGSARHTLRLRYSGLTPHGFLTGTWGYTGWARIYLPPTSTIVSVSGAQLSASSELTRKLLQGWFYVEFGHTTDITVVYDVDASSLKTASHGPLQFFWQKQAGRAADPISVELLLPPNWSLQKATVGSAKAADGPISSDLSVDRSYEFQYQPG